MFRPGMGDKHKIPNNVAFTILAYFFCSILRITSVTIICLILGTPLVSKIRGGGLENVQGF